MSERMLLNGLRKAQKVGIYTDVDEDDADRESESDRSDHIMEQNRMG